MKEVSDEDLVILAGLGAFMTAMGVSLGAVQTANKTVEVVEDAAGKVSAVINDPVGSLLYAMGKGRKGGFL